MTVNPGEFLAIVGRSGCGKSTLLLLIARLDKLDAGHIAIGQMPARERSHQVRMMFQDARLLPWQSVLRNLGIGATGDWKP
jgi:sulfonate transport system ATP-binding protein